MIKIYGASDDLVEIEGPGISEEYSVYPSGNLGYAGSWMVNRVVIVRAFFTNGLWNFSVGLTSEGQRLDNLVFITASDVVPYSAQVNISIKFDESPTVFKLSDNGVTI